MEILDEDCLQIFLRNSTTVDPYKLKIDGCGEYCELSKVKELLENQIPGDIESECRTDGSLRTLKLSREEIVVYT
jgi:hypothetical protein